eukprot:4387840-Pyramimonas_sp.AAC.1
MPWWGPLAALGEERLEHPPGALGPPGTAWARLGAHGSTAWRLGALVGAEERVGMLGRLVAPGSSGERLGALR